MAEGESQLSKVILLPFICTTLFPVPDTHIHAKGGEKALHLKALAVPAEDWSLVSSTHVR